MVGLVLVLLRARLVAQLSFNDFLQEPLSDSKSSVFLNETQISGGTVDEQPRYH